MSSNEQTSTTDLKENVTERTEKELLYREGLKDIIFEWAKKLPRYSNASSENIKQNIVNDLIEKLNEMYSEVNEDYYDEKLSMEIDKFIDSLPMLSKLLENKGYLDQLKEALVEKIYNLNNNIKRHTTAGNKEQSNESNLKEKSTNTLEYYTTREDSDNRRSLSKIYPFYKKTAKEPNTKYNKQQNKKLENKIYKEMIYNWIDDIHRNLDKNEKIIMTDALNNRLKELLHSKTTANYKLMLKAEIFNFLNDYADKLFLSPENYTYLNRLSEKIAVKLLSAKFSNEEVYSMSYTSCFKDSADDVNSWDCDEEEPYQHLVQEIVREQLLNFNISTSIATDIINIILKNIKFICMRQDYYVEIHIFNILKFCTDLSDYNISTLTSNILDQIRTEATSKYLTAYNFVCFNNNMTRTQSFISIYKSEQEIRGPNTVLPTLKRKLSANSQHITMEEKKYVNRISQVLKTWVNALPVGGAKLENKKNENTIINNLAYDILDQVKLEQLVPETRAEKDKFLSFFINRWLNRLNWFHNIADAQPYVENLIQELKKVSLPSFSKTNNKQYVKKTETSSGSNKMSPLGKNANGKEESHDQPLKLQAVLKEFISKYIEHNYDEDNALTREVFGHILKKELQKLSTPSRREVYTNLNNTEDDNIGLEKLYNELQLINIISDWLKQLPVEGSFNVSGNEERAQWIIDLAKMINETEKSSSQSNDYYQQLKSRIMQHTEILPIDELYKENMTNFIDNLVSNIDELQSSPQCCAFTNEASLNVSSVPEHNMSDFIEEYIRDKSDVIGDDELKLDACSLRIYKEVDNMAKDNPTSLSTSQVYNRLSEMSQQTEELGKRFNFKLNYAKEISNFLNNLPLLAIKDTKDVIVTMISNLTEKMTERWQIKNVDPNNSQVDDKLRDYIKTWIKELPLDPKKDIVMPVVVQQIWNRMERVNNGIDEPSAVLPSFSDNPKSICESLSPCCKRNPLTKDFEKLDPGTEIVEAIEGWCNNLPIHADTISMERTLKEEFSTRLYKKINELNKMPDCFDNNITYLQLLEEEIDSGLNDLPQNTQLQHSREMLKRQLLNKINESRNVIREKTAGLKYRQELEKTIEISLPNPVFFHQKDCPGFNIYKSLLAQLFILENFDHAHDDFKINCIRKIRNKIDNNFENVENINSVSLTKDQLFNQLYSSLFSVPVPNENSIAREVEEIKTRCIIEVWFESLPIREAASVEELLEREQIISMLAKRIHAFEKSCDDPNDKIKKEINKWLMKLPILPDHGYSFDQLTSALLQGLILSKNERTCKLSDRNVTLEEFLLDKNNNKGIVATSPPALPSSDRTSWFTPTSSSSPKIPRSCCKKGGKPTDLLLETIEKWCQQLPLPENSQQDKDNAKTIRDNLIVKLIIKISELNLNSEAFENDVLYDSLLDDEIEELMSTLPTSIELQQNKNLLINQFKDSIKSIKPLIKNEKSRYEYKQVLKNTTDEVLGQPHNVPPTKGALLRTLRDEIVDDFIVYKFSKGNENNRDVYKIMLQRVVQRYVLEKESLSSDPGTDPVEKGNQLMNELSKVPTPSDDAISDEVNEILMKFEVNVFFKELPIADDENKQPLQSQVKYTLAKRLSDFKKDGFKNNHEEIKNEIMKNLHKVLEEIDPQKVDAFIKRLETTENPKFPQLPHSSNQNMSLSNNDVWSNDNLMSINNQNSVERGVNKENNEDQQWMSLLSETSGARGSNYRGAIQPTHYTKSTDNIVSPRALGQGFDRSLNQSELSYKQFREGGVLTSSVTRKNETIQIIPNDNGEVNSLRSNQNLGGSIGLKRDVPMTADTNRITNSIGQDFQLLDRDSMQQRGLGANLRQSNLSIRPQCPSSCSQQTDESQQPAIPYPALSNQSSQQSRHTCSDCCRNQKVPDVQKYTFNSYRPSQFTSENRDVIQQQPCRPLSMLERTTSKQNIDDVSIRSLPQDPMSQFTQNAPHINSRCNKNCRRPSIVLLSPPYTDSNNLVGENKPKANLEPITDENEPRCSCISRSKKQFEGNPLCPNHMRKQCRVCNRPNPFRYMGPYRRYYGY
ncbi:unnamed protein product [Danaus chrysippus]|uniref:(African queen) hypothetical protein n=1 Tax=Danaus chrysippus TaxID=151541 RepID=A0A8J2QWK1_9NEOP|nr:unnamed protein product [Danaus chrysippus]